MNEIPLRQNEPRQLQLLKAQRVLYGSAKNWFTWRTVIALLFATFGPLVTSFNNLFSAYLAVAIFAYLFLDKFVLERREIRLKKIAAKVQELFDTSVFDFNWNSRIAGQKPDEEIISSTQKVKMRKGGDRLSDWYAPEVGEVDMQFARLLCQRSSTWWDNSLRTAFVYALIAVSSILILVAIFLSITFKLSIGQVVINILWLLPLLTIVIELINKNHDGAVAAAELKQHLDTEIQLWKDGNGVDDVSISRGIQDQIYCYRVQSPLIFDWFYWFFRNTQESQMTFSVNAHVQEYLSGSIS